VAEAFFLISYYTLLEDNKKETHFIYPQATGLSKLNSTVGVQSSMYKVMPQRHPETTTFGEQLLVKDRRSVNSVPTHVDRGKCPLLGREPYWR